MPWSNQGGGGGPWGGGGGPWGGGSGGSGGGGGRGQSPWGGGQQPNIEDLIKRSQDKFKKGVPGGFWTGKGLLVVLAALVALWFASGFYTVEPDEQGVVLRFGEFVGTTDPGLNYHLPAPIETVETVVVTTQRRTEVGFVSDARGTARGVDDESLMLTGDENIIDINFVVIWNVGNAADFLFQVADPNIAVKFAAESAMREVIARTPIQPALKEARGQIEVDVRQNMQEILDSYKSGISVNEVQLQKVDPPNEVRDAFLDVQRAEADRERMRNEAEAYRNDIIPRAQGQAVRINQEAQAYKEQVVADATGEASRFNQIYAAYAQAKDVTVRRMYLETMQKVLGGANKVIMDNGGADSGGAQSVVPYLPLSELAPRTSRSGSNAGDNSAQKGQ